MSGKEADIQSRSTGLFSRLFFAALCVAAVVFILRAIAPQTIGEQARRRFEEQLQNHYIGYDISVGRGRYEPSVGLIFEDLRIADPSAPIADHAWSLVGSGAREVLRIEKLTVVATTQPENLLEKRNPLVTQRVIIEGVDAEAWLNPDGQLSLRSLWPPPEMGPSAPRIEVRKAAFRLVDTKSASEPVEFKISDLLFVNGPTQISGEEPATSTAASQSLTLRGSSDMAGLIQVQATVDGRGLAIRGAIQNARLRADLMDRLSVNLPAAWRDALEPQVDQIRGLDCIYDVTFGLNHPTGGEVDYRLKATVRDGRFEHSSLPQPVNQLNGLILCDPSGITIQSANGVCGDAICRLSGSISHYDWPDAARFDCSVTGLRLDDRLERSIPAPLRSGWDKLQPLGRIDVVSASAWHQEGRWMTEATIDCKGVDVRYAKFPYPVEQLVGRVVVRGDIARCEHMQGRIGGRRLECAFQLPTKAGVTPEKAFIAKTDGPIAIDSTLLRSLSPRGEPSSKLESFVRSLQPRGLVHLTKASLLTDLNGKQSRTFDMQITDGHLRYAKFPYPLYNVIGSIKVNDRVVTLSGFHGTNANAGQIQCEGVYRMRAKHSAQPPDSVGRSASALALNSETDYARGSDSQLKLEFKALNIPMDESLRTSLPETARHTWSALSPSGVLDQLDVVVSQQGSNERLALDITGIETESQQITNSALSIQPKCLPYRMDIADANVNFDGERVTIDRMTAVHGATRLRADGRCTQDPNGRWQLILDIQSGRVSPDSELVAALPSQLREAMNRLQLRRPIGIRGNTGFLFADERFPNPVIDWDVALQLEGNRIGDVGPVHALRGEVFARGTSDAQGLRSDGEIRIDSMHVNELQLTNIRGPFAIRGDRLRLGAQSNPSLPTTANPTQIQQVTYETTKGMRKITGKLFGGEVELAGEVELSSASFDVDVSLRHGKVPTLLADLGKGRSELTGTISCQTKIEGILGTTDLLKGVGSARVTGANVYQLPLLVQLLNLLRITPTEDVAFTDVDVDFTLIENQMTFNDLKMWGDLVALQGGGTLDRRGELDLTFNTRVSPQNVFTSVLRPLRSQRYTLWTVDVRGPLESPTIERRALDTLERLFPVKNGQ